MLGHLKLILVLSSANKGISLITQRKMNESLVQYLLHQREAKLDKRTYKKKTTTNNKVDLAI